MTALALELRRPFLLAYAAVALALSAALFSFGLRRSPAEMAGWVAAYATVALVAVLSRDHGPILAGALAFLLGFLRTWRPGFNLDLGLALVALAAGVYVLGAARRSARSLPIDLAELSLLAVAAWSLVSLAFALARVHGFTPAPGFEYRSYQFNDLGYSSDEALIRTVIGAASSFTWFGLYEYARRARLRRPTLNAVVFTTLLLNTAVLLVQRFVAPGFLIPPGFPGGRLNGVTSFCYALGDVVAVLFLLLPAWGIARGRFAVLTGASLTMLLFGAAASGSRTALAAMLIAALLWAAVRVVRLSRQQRRRPALAVLAAAALLVALAATAYRLTPPDRRTPLGRLKDGIAREGLVGHVVTQRLASYPLLFRVMRTYPLSGVGAGLYPAEVSKQRALLMPALQLEEWFLLVSFAPNQFLNTGVELGGPAMLALLIVFAHALVRTARGGLAAADCLVAVGVLAAAMQLGPTLYNSEALVFAWLIVGGAGRGEPEDQEGGGPQPARRLAGAGATAAILAGVVVLALAGHLMSRRALAVETQWQRLRWRLGMGMLAAQPDGRWCRPEATFSVDTPARAVAVRWHAGDAAASAYRADVSFYVDGALVERGPARSGVVRDTVLPLPAVDGYKRISVRVTPAFVPAAFGAGSDRRSLGIFVHSVRDSRP